MFLCGNNVFSNVYSVNKNKTRTEKTWMIEISYYLISKFAQVIKLIARLGKATERVYIALKVTFDQIGLKWASPDQSNGQVIQCVPRGYAFDPLLLAHSSSDYFETLLSVKNTKVFCKTCYLRTYKDNKL